MSAKNLSSKEKRALSTVLDLIKNLDNKVFHVFEDEESSYGIIGSKKLKYEDEIYDAFIKKDRKFKQILDKKVGVSTVNKFVNAGSKAIKAINMDEAFNTQLLLVKLNFYDLSPTFISRAQLLQ
ncbi:7065_t:CDS:2, partial [Racocetra fulgida]